MIDGKMILWIWHSWNVCIEFAKNLIGANFNFVAYIYASEFSKSCKYSVSAKAEDHFPMCIVMRSLWKQVRVLPCGYDNNRK